MNRDIIDEIDPKMFKISMKSMIRGLQIEIFLKHYRVYGRTMFGRKNNFLLAQKLIHCIGHRMDDSSSIPKKCQVAGSQKEIENRSMSTKRISRTSNSLFRKGMGTPVLSGATC